MDRFQVIVIGAGAAGLMAAGQSAGLGAETLLLEKMRDPGRKLRITGKGRCNLTNIAPIRAFIDHFGPNGRFLYSAFNRFFAEDLRAFFEALGVETVTERGGRVFPESDSAALVVDALAAWARAEGASLWTGAGVTRLLAEDGRITGVQIGGRQVGAGAVIVATGGASYPRTGSSGDGYRLAGALGHHIVPVRPALVPLVTEGDLARRLQGLSLRNVKVSLLVDGEVQAAQFGEMLFTHFGVSGPVVLTLSKHAVDGLRAGAAVWLSIDLKPALDPDKLDARLLRDIDAHGKRQYETLLGGLLPRSLIPVCIDLTGIPADCPAHQITAEERARLRGWLKDFRLALVGHRGFKAAIVTAGGVDLDEVDPRTMESRLVAGLYCAGEVLDLDADTGGYNLQAAFSTGWLAGRSAAR